MITSRKNRKKDVFYRLNILDGFAIVFIVIYHALGGLKTSDAIFISKYLVVFGLSLFTFSAGFKFGFNHSDELEEKKFLKKYFIKRFVRLYKPYIGYSLLISVPLFFVTYISVYYLNLDYKGANIFWTDLTYYKLLYFILGKNFICGHLWYLISLIVITTLCFFILYYSNIHTLYIFALILLTFEIISWDYLSQHSEFWFRTTKYMVIYIFGIFCSLDERRESSKKMLIYSIAVTTLLLLSIYNSSIWINKYDFYSIMFPPLGYILSDYLLKFGYISEWINKMGGYSFQIYLFHWPLVLPIIQRLTMNILKIDFVLVPYFVSFLAIILCIYVYKVTKKLKLNLFFE